MLSALLRRLWPLVLLVWTGLAIAIFCALSDPLELGPAVSDADLYFALLLMLASWRVGLQPMDQREGAGQLGGRGWLSRLLPVHDAAEAHLHLPAWRCGMRQRLWFVMLFFWLPAFAAFIVFYFVYGSGVSGISLTLTAAFAISMPALLGFSAGASTVHFSSWFFLPLFLAVGLFLTLFLGEIISGSWRSLYRQFGNLSYLQQITAMNLRMQSFLQVAAIGLVALFWVWFTDRKGPGHVGLWQAPLAAIVIVGALHLYIRYAPQNWKPYLRNVSPQPEYDRLWTNMAPQSPSAVYPMLVSSQDVHNPDGGAANYLFHIPPGIFPPKDHLHFQIQLDLGDRTNGYGSYMVVDGLEIEEIRNPPGAEAPASGTRTVILSLPVSEWPRVAGSSSEIARLKGSLTTLQCEEIASAPADQALDYQSRELILKAPPMTMPLAQEVWARGWMPRPCLSWTGSGRTGYRTILVRDDGLTWQEFDFFYGRGTTTSNAYFSAVFYHNDRKQDFPPATHRKGATEMPSAEEIKRMTRHFLKINHIWRSPLDLQLRKP